MSKSKTKLNVKKVGVLLKPKTVSDYTSVLPNLVTWLKRRKIQAFFSTEDKPRVEKILKGLSKNANFTDLLSLHKDMDLNITLGGDGTLLGFGRLATRDSLLNFQKQSFLKNLPWSSILNVN
jgi:NAD+ kinase